MKILSDTTSIASNLLNYYGSNYNAKLSVKSFKGNFYVNSVRQFNIESKKLTVVHLGSGQPFELTKGGTYPPDNEYKAKFVFNDIEKSVFNEPVLHHGQGFDFYIWE